MGVELEVVENFSISDRGPLPFCPFGAVVASLWIYGPSCFSVLYVAHFIYSMRKKYDHNSGRILEDSLHSLYSLMYIE